MTAGRLLVIDATFDDRLARQLTDRGRKAVSVRTHHFGDASDDVLLTSLANEYAGQDWMLITSDDAMPNEHKGAIDSLGHLTIATVSGDRPKGMHPEHYKYEVVHRWVHRMQERSAGEIWRYHLAGSNLWRPKRRNIARP